MEIFNSVPPPAVRFYGPSAWSRPGALASDRRAVSCTAAKN